MPAGLDSLTITELAKKASLYVSSRTPRYLRPPTPSAAVPFGFPLPAGVIHAIEHKIALDIESIPVLTTVNNEPCYSRP